MTEGTVLAAFVDGVALGGDEARALWKDFSAHMDEHEGDVAGFAAKRGWASIAPEFRLGQAVLVVRTTPNAPGPPAPAAQKKGGGGRPRARSGKQPGTKRRSR
jgi:hypothetical protein